MLRDALPKIITETLPGPRAQEIISRREAVLPNAVRCPYPVAVARGEGAMIEDVDGNRFMDWVGGVGVLNIGYSRPEVVEAVREQAGKFFHGMIGIMTHEGYVSLAEKLCALAPVRGESRKCYLVNSGAEGNENAVKIAKAATGRTNVIVFSGAFHGRTMMTMAMTSKKSYYAGMGPLPGGVFRARFPYYYRLPEGISPEKADAYYLDSIYEVFEQYAPADTVAAIVVEPLQGEGGFIPAPISWVRALRKLCDEHGILLIADEVQSGFCRTGRMFACCRWEEAGAAPDILVTAKSIAAGIPMAAVIARTEIMDSPLPATLGSTFSGNALACAAALKVIEILEKEDLAGRSEEIGKTVTARFEKLKETCACVGDVRGLGGMVGIEFVADKASKTPAPELTGAIIDACARRGLLVESAGVFGNVIRFLAPLVITDKQLEAGLDIMEAVITELAAEQ